uniref:(California timema) hypothetical protein n=1 Tax=Timema californicum TaxID=61474 RepID=A0A7R9JMF8_TIMCA|nr:unnamed protein product [Timema californicum]
MAAYSQGGERQHIRTGRGPPVGRMCRARHCCGA